MSIFLKQKQIFIFLVIFVSFGYSMRVIASPNYSWMSNYDYQNAIVNRIAVPEGFERISLPKNSFENWLRYLPLKAGKPPVYLYNGIQKYNQKAHYAVIDIDVGRKDLQQCADAIIRLRAEYFYSKRNYDQIHFNFTSGDRASYREWIKGYRPSVKGNKVKWYKKHSHNQSYSNFKKYLETVFMYAGSYSLSRELKLVKNIKEIRIGDVFIEGGFPGHSIIVVDIAINKKNQKKLFLLAQSYMPAQEIHILINPSNAQLSPWYEIDFGDILDTPEWEFDVKNS